MPEQENKPTWFCQRCMVMMEPKDGNVFFKCPVCGTEVWPEERDKTGVEELSTDAIAELMQDNLVQHQTSVFEAMIGGKAAHGGGGNKNGHSSSQRKMALQKPTTNQLYTRLTD